ncbi:MAG TPA: ATP-binding cassette domain-containing protein [Microbacteriaceae bacterium]|nr:ATP-binding cassette domain-containing protein [Microbacteriaceae bacterium]
MHGLVAQGFGWRPHGSVTPIVDDFNMQVTAGERVLVLGPSGAGKSTLLLAFAGVLSVAEPGEWSGSVVLDGVDVRERTYRAGLVRQDPETNVLMQRVLDEVSFPPENLGLDGHAVAARAQEALERTGLTVQPGRRTAALSGGEKQRLAVASLVAMRPEVWLLDEPTAQLDPLGARMVRDAIEDALRPDDILVLVEHHVELWWDLVTRVIVIDANGQLVSDGSRDEFARRAREVGNAVGVWTIDDVVPEAKGFDVSGAPLLGLRDVQLIRGGMLDGFDFELRAGEVACLTGPNGSGKSTLAMTIAGLLPPRTGRVEASESWAPRRRGRLERNPLHWRGEERTARIATVFQQPDLQFLGGTVRDEILLGASTEAVAFELLERLGLAGRLEQSPRTLSGGQKRRLSVATALASPADVIVADEPTFGQDRHTWLALVQLLAAARDSGRTLVMPSHDERLVQALAPRLLSLAGDVSVPREGMGL